jgi:Xaa-Pro aminopeptidase
VITSSGVGHWFTSFLEPHEWHDLCQARSAWFILTHAGDYLYMTPTGGGEHFNTTRRSTWVTHIRAIVERFEWPRHEIWDLQQMPQIFAELGLKRGRLGFELGDCMTLGITVSDFLRLRDLMPGAQLVDGSPVIRRLMSIHTPEEIERVRKACQAGVWIHNQVPHVLRPGLTERELIARLTEVFYQQFGAGYTYQGDGAWDVRNLETGDSNFYHTVVTDRVFKAGDLICRALSGVSYRGYPGDVDRVWYISTSSMRRISTSSMRHIGEPPAVVRHWYRTAWECNRAMAEAIKPGNLCSDIYAAYARIKRKNGLPERLVGRVGHGIRNTGGLSVHPDNHTVLEPGMIISVEPMFGHAHGWYDLEDQYLVTETGREILHEPAPEEIPLISA